MICTFVPKVKSFQATQVNLKELDKMKEFIRELGQCSPGNNQEYIGLNCYNSDGWKFFVAQGDWVCRSSDNTTIWGNTDTFMRLYYEKV